MARNTRSDVEAAFNRLRVALGKPEAEWNQDDKGNNRAKVGGWALDYNPTFGGSIIEETMNEHGGVKMPLGYRRMSNAEFVVAVQFALDAINIARGVR